MRDKKKIVALNLPWNVSKDQLRDYFSQFGKVISVDFKKNENGRCSGCGFIVFADIRTVQFVLSRSQTLPKLNNRTLYMRRYRQNYEKWSPNIVLYDLPANICSKNLTDELSVFGPIVSVDVSSPGAGYATFKNKWDARKCVDKGEIFLNNKKIKVFSDTESEKSPRVKIQSSNLTSPRELKLFMKDLPSSITKTILQRHFSKYGSNAVVITQSKNKRQFADISFTERNALERALRADHCINGCKLTVQPYKSETIKRSYSSRPNSSRSISSNATNLLLSICSPRWLISGIVPLVFAYPYFSIIALFSVFLFVYYRNVFALKERKYVLFGGVSIFVAAMFVTTYLTNSFQFREFLNAKVKVLFLK